MHIRAEGLTDIGRCRQSNEDSFAVDNKQLFYIVADGVGGQPAGEVASRLVTEHLPEVLADLVGGDQSAADEILDRAVRKVNDIILATTAEKPALKGMSTTVVAAWCQSDQVSIANVGDSRAYLIRDQQIKQLSEDHTVHAEQQREGLADDESSSRLAHVLTRCLGLENDVDVCIGSLSVTSGDRLLLCSDGLTDSLSEEVIRSVVLSAEKPGEACRMLVELANRNGGRDNITVVLIFFESDTFKNKISSLLGRRI